MRRALRLAALPAALLLSPDAAGAQGLVARLPGLGPTSFSITSTTVARYRGQNFDTNAHDDHFGSFTERLDVSALATPWRLYLRLDGFVPFNHDTTCAPNEAALCYLNWDLRPGGTGRDRAYRGRADNTVDSVLPERVALRYQRRGLTLEAGDFYQVFGRGISLSFRKVDPIGLDTTLRGGRFEYERGRMTLRAFAGLANPQNLDPISLGVFDDPRDLLGGGAVAARVGPNEEVEVSGHVVHAGFERLAESNRQDDVDVAGWRVEAASLFGGDLSLYLEANVLRRTQREGAASMNHDLPATVERFGRGVFGAAQVSRGRWTLLVEWKDYTHYLVAPTESANVAPRDIARIYSTAPSLERDDQRVFTNANTRGGRFRADYTFPSSPWILSLNSVLYGWAETTNPQGDLIDPWDPVHGYLTTHTYVSVRRRARPVTAPSRPAGGADEGARRGAGAGAAPQGGANITAGGLGGASVTRVASGDFNLLATVGYRREFHVGTAPSDGRSAPDFEAGDIKHESLQFDIDYAFPVGRNDSIEVRLDHRFERNYTFDRIPGSAPLGDPDRGLFLTSRGGLAVSWSHGLPLVVSAMLRWDNTNRPTGSREFFDVSPFGSTAEALLPTLYPSLEVRWNFSTSNFVRVFGGMTPGGRVCSGGVCRDVPLFQGGIAELVLRI